MSWYKVFYLFSLADKISGVSFYVSFVTGIVLSICLLIWVLPLDGEDKTKWTIIPGLIKRLWLPFLFFLTCWTFIPNRKDMTLIVAGGSVGQYIMSDENAQAIPQDMTRFLRKEILEATADFSGEVKEQLNIKTRRDSLMELGKDELIKLLEKQ